MLTVIAYYPGGGGNRYMRYILGQEYAGHNIKYDNQITGQDRYLLDHAVLKGNIILTHCVNQSRIKSLINNCDITFLKSDIKKSLHREWKLLGHARYKPDYLSLDLKLEHYNAIKDPAWPQITNEQQYQSLPKEIKNEVESMYKEINHLIAPDGEYQKLLTAFSSISWHDNYYQQYPVDVNNCDILDIDHSDSEFAQVMRNELNSQIDPMFELAWHSYYEFGKDAELTQIYEQQK